MEFVRHHRSQHSIVVKAHKLGVTIKARWTDEEEHKLSEYYSTHKQVSKTELTVLFPDRPITQCINKASLMGLAKSRFNWTPSALQQLQELYPVQGAKCADLIGCSATACAQMANKHGIKFIKPEAKPKPECVKFAWTQEEDDIIKTMYSTDMEKAISLLSNRSRTSIVARAMALGVRADRTRKVRCIETSTTYSVKDAAKLVGKTSGSIVYAIKSQSVCGGYHWEYVEE